MEIKSKAPLLQVLGLELVRVVDQKRKILVTSFDLTLKRGEIIFLHGASGQGKSSLLWAIAGLLEFSKGDILLENRSILLEPYYRWRQAVSLVMQKPVIFDGNIRENLLVGTKLKNRKPVDELEFSDDRLMEMMQAIGLEGVNPDRNAAELSIGQMSRIQFLRNFILKPRLILLDEPLASLDDNNIEKFFSFLYPYLKNGGAVIMASHGNYQDKFNHDMNSKTIVLNNENI